METIEFKEVCKECKGTGLYIGMAERNEATTVCYNCKGTGYNHFKRTYTPFKERLPHPTAKQVYECNPGIMIGSSQGFSLSDFGGMSYADWVRGVSFTPKMAMRKYTCPAWWFQTADSTKEPNWSECKLGISFSRCEHFENKSKCWERWDKENLINSEKD